MERERESQINVYCQRDLIIMNGIVCKLLILNELELMCLHAAKRFQVLVFIVCTQLNDFKYRKWLNSSIWPPKWDPNWNKHSRPEWTWNGCAGVIYILQSSRTGIVIFWPSTRPKNAIPRWCTGRKWHIPMASNRKRSRGRIKAYYMGQGEGPTVPLQWYTGRE